jgi:hypothetical protein
VKLLLPLRRSPRGHVFAGCLLGLVLCLVGCRTASEHQASRTKPVSPAPYTRVSSPDTNTFSLQIALRQFVPRNGRGPIIWLSGVSHIGESNYYAGLQRHLDAQSVVLFEGVGAHDRKLRFEPEDQSSIQHTLAQSLGLVFQLRAIDYDRAHFHNSDLTIPQLQRMMMGQENVLEDQEGAATTEEPGEDDAPGGAQSPELRELMGVMNGSTVLGMLVHLGVKFLGSSPKLQAMTKLVMIETLGRFQGDLAEAKGIPPEMQRLMTVIIRGRNDVVMRDLKKQLGRGKRGQSISVFYGAGHMADLEKRLVEELRYRRRDEVWATALTVNTRAAGLSAAELKMVQDLVRWQLNALQTGK